MKQMALENFQITMLSPVDTKDPHRVCSGDPMAGTCGNRTHLGSSSPPATVLKTAGHTSTHLLPNA